MDTRVLGQAFQSAANVYAGGLMDRYHRKNAEDDWKRRTDYAQNLQNEEMDKRFQEAERVRQENAFRDALKKDIETNPELSPFMERALGGDEEAGRVLSIYAGSKYKMSKDEPLSSDEVAELAPLPPGVRHNILQGHLTALRKRADEESDRLKKAKDLEYLNARIGLIGKQTEKLLADQNQQGAAEAAKIGAESLLDASKKREKARSDIKTIEDNLEVLWGQLGEKLRTGKTPMHVTPDNLEDVRKTLKASRGEADPAVALMDRISKSTADKAKIERWIQEDAAKNLPPGVAPEPEQPEPEADVLEQDTQKFLYELPEADRAEVFDLMRSRPDLTQEQIVQVYILFKQREQKAKLNTKNRQMSDMRTK